MSVELLAPPAEDLETAVAEALAAEEVISRTRVTVVDRAYTIQPLTAARLGLLGSLILREVKAALGTGVLDAGQMQTLFADLTPEALTEVEGLLDKVLAFWELLPATFGKAHGAHPQRGSG
jgi:hypothetical protein